MLPSTLAPHTRRHRPEGETMTAKGTFVYGLDKENSLALSFPAHEARTLEVALFDEFDHGRGVRVTFHVIISGASGYRTFYLTASSPIHFAYADQDETAPDAQLLERFRTAIAEKRALHFPVERMPEEVEA